MKLPWLKPVLEHDGPFVSVYLDTTRTDPQAAGELEARWAQMRARLREDGASDRLLTEIEETVLSPSRIGGRHGRAVLAAEDRILVDRVLPAPPLEESAYRGDRPRLLPLVQVTPFAVTQLLIEVDRAGADLHLRAPENPALTPSADGLGEDASVEGGHDELHKASMGGGSQHGWRANNYEARVEDSWERNAEAVAATVDRVVREHRPDMVLLTGDVRSSSLLKAALGQEALEVLCEVPGGTRGQSLARGPFREELTGATMHFIETRERELVDRVREGLARDGAAATSAADVALALERGQVDELAVVTGREPSTIEDLLDGALRTDAAVTALREDAEALVDGVGALLRWRDPATPSASIGSMSGDARREGASSS